MLFYLIETSTYCFVSRIFTATRFVIVINIVNIVRIIAII